MRKGLSESMFLAYTIGAIFLLMAIRIFHSQLVNVYNSGNYLAIHTVLEIISIAISSAIVLYGIKRFAATRSSHMLLLSFTFLTVGVIDLLHTLSFKGMPFFITESSIQKATWFWVTARGIQALLMLSLILLPDKKVKRFFRPIVIAAALVLTAGIGFFIISFEHNLPLLVIEGQGTTVVKNAIEYGISFILFLSLVISLYHYYLNKEQKALYFALACVFLLLTELIFTIYQSVFDLDNLLGHIFKVVGFYFILKGFYFHFDKRDEKSIIQPCLSHHPGLFFQVKRKKNQYVCIQIDGQLLGIIGYNQDEMIGKPISEFFPIIGATLDDYCHLSEKLEECITFEISYLDKSLLFSIKRFVDDENQNVILGTVMDMTGILPENINPKIIKSSRSNVM